MADFEQKEGGMSIFKNGYKNAPNQPDYKGTALIDGKEKQVPCWLKKTRAGDSFFSCQVQEKYVKPESNTQGSSEGITNPNHPDYVAPTNNDFDDDIPF